MREINECVHLYGSGCGFVNIFKSTQEVGTNLMDRCNEKYGPDHDNSQRVTMAVMALGICCRQHEEALQQTSPMNALLKALQRLHQQLANNPGQRLESDVEKLNNNYGQAIAEALADPGADADPAPSAAAEAD